MMPAIKNSDKKGSFLVPFVIFGAIITLLGLLMLISIKANSFEKTLGDRQLELFDIYQIGEKYLHFVDESVKISMRPALLKISKNGLKKNPDCLKDNSQKYTLWARQDMDSECKPVTKECYPIEDEEKNYFVDSFKPEYMQLLQEFNDKRSSLTDFPAKIPTGSINPKVESIGDKLELVGTATDPILLQGVIAKAPYNLVLRYKVKPSFRIGIDVNFIKDGAYMASKAPQLLMKGDAEIRTNLDNFNAENPALKWKLADYSTPSTSCPHIVGTCNYCDEYLFDFGFNMGCIKEHEGKWVETISYKDVYAAVSVANGKGFYVSDPPSSPPQLKSISYDFGLNWLEETGRRTDCVP